MSALERYEFPAEMPRATDVRVVVDRQELPVLRTQIGAFVSFGMRGPVSVVFDWTTPVRDVCVRPLSAGIKLAGNSFTLDAPRNLSVEINGDIDHPLFIFANPVRDDTPRPTERRFTTGRVHEAGEIVLRDGESLYLEGGAVVRGTVRATGARDIAIRGPGILDAGTRTFKTNTLVLRECRDARLEDFTVLDSFGWTIHLSASQRVNVNNVRTLGYFTLKDADRFHCILHGGEVAVPDRTTMILVIFVIRRPASERYDIYIINKFFRADGSKNKTMMSKKDIAAADIEETLTSTATTFALGLKLKGGIDITWDELDLRKVLTKDEQIERIKQWGKLTNVRVTKK